MACDPFKQNHKRLINDALFGIYSDLDENNLFMSIGKVTQWSGIDDENVVPAPIAEDTVRAETDFWRSVFAHKRIDREDVSLVVRRYDWEPGKVYQPYSDNIDLFDDMEPAQFYALVDEERVYKCIDNASDSPSLVAPVHTDSEIRKLSDGYRWKFLYQIPESRRKFLTKTQGNSIGYMPVEYVEYLKQNDDRFLQWNVQEASIDGEIAHIRLDQDIRPFVRSDRCLFPSNSNVVVASVTGGETGITVASPFMVSIPDYYKNMVFSVDSNGGQGQRRRITNFLKPAGLPPDQAFIVVDKPISIPLAAGVNASTFSIVPNVIVEGDGSANSTEYNPYAKSAEISVRFGGTSDVTGDYDYYESPRTIDSFEMVDPGKDYTFATVRIVAGLTADTTKVPSLEGLATAIMSPPGGHGSNPVKELGCSSIMIVKDFDRTENGSVSTENEFRQVGILLNPELTYPQYRLKFFGNGATGLFSPGLTVGVTGTSVYGEVVSWYGGASGQVGTSELVLENVKNGGITTGNTISSLVIYSVDKRTIAGTDARRLLKTTVVPVPPYLSFDGTSNHFKRGMYVQGVGNYSISQKASRAVGEVYSWEPEYGTNTIGDLYIENVQGEFYRNEALNQFSGYTGTFTYGPSGGALVSEMVSVVQGGKETYDQTTNLVVQYDGTNLFFDTTFDGDQYITFNYGNTSSANGYVMDWQRTSGATGNLIVAGTQGTFVPGMTFGYVSGRNEAVSTITAVVHEGDLVYRSGEILYIQNMNPVQRSPDQKEEIKIVIEF